VSSLLCSDGRTYYSNQIWNMKFISYNDSCASAFHHAATERFRVTCCFKSNVAWIGKTDMRTEFFLGGGTSWEVITWRDERQEK
jgi:hypothetical protein